MSHRIYNFSAGPAILPEPVLEEAAQGVREINGSGMSLLEVSHRGKDYEAIHADAETRLLRILGLKPEEYATLFMQGGASQQFAMVAQNFLKPGQTADYVVSGDWGAKALKEAKYFGDAREAASSKGEGYSEIPKSFTQTPGARYVHITTNNTIEGTEYFDLPETGETPLIADTSSDFLALRRDYSKFAFLYGGAQKKRRPGGRDSRRRQKVVSCHGEYRPAQDLLVQHVFREPLAVQHAADFRHLCCRLGLKMD